VTMSGLVLSSRAFRAYDGDGTFLGDFAAWPLAHEWAHQRAAEPLTPLPVEIEDRSRVHVEQVWPDRCQVLHHQPPVVVPFCPLAQPGATASRRRLLDDTDAAPPAQQGPGR
jgi:hypothetical protein